MSHSLFVTMPPVSRPVSDESTDPVLETQVFWVKYRMEILIALIVVLVALAGYGGYRLYLAKRDASAADLLANAKTPDDFQKVFAQYPDAPAAATACLRLAESQRKAGKFAEANTTLQTFVRSYPKHDLVATAKSAMAGNLESLGKKDEALEMYKRIAAENPRSFNAPLALLAEVPLLKQKGQIDEARRVCETVLTQYRDSYASSDAQRYLGTLKPTVAPAPVSTAAPVASPANTVSSVAPTP
ncbi:MAG: tetratricopeptide repeat protein [Chthoniobacterales bacterium]